MNFPFPTTPLRPRPAVKPPRRLLDRLPAKAGMVELALFFALVCGGQYFITGSLGEFGISPHPFWIVVILLSVQYGTAEGIVAALAATVILFLPGFPQRTPSEDFDFYLLRTAAEPAAWLLTATILGSIRDLQKEQIDALVQKWGTAVEQRDSISDHCQKLRLRNQSLQRQIARGKSWSIPAAYAAIQQLRSQPGQMELVAKCMDMLVGAEKFSVFRTNGNSSLEQAASWGWATENAWRTQFSARDNLYKAVVVERRSLASSRPADAAVLQKQGDFALPLVSPATGAVIGMLKVEEISEHDLTTDTERDLQFLAEQIAYSLEQPRIEPIRAVPESKRWSDKKPWPVLVNETIPVPGAADKSTPSLAAQAPAREQRSS
jgi:hypothetical protein